MYNLAIKEIRQESPDTVSILFDVPQLLAEEFSFQSGQYLTLEAMINGEAVRRSYSLCSAPSDGEWRVAVKKVAQGKFSTWANEVMSVKDKIKVLPPTGNFTLSTQQNKSNNYIGFAAGSGITPIISMIKSVLKKEQRSTFTLFYGNKNTESIIFRDEIEDLKDQYLDRFSVHHIFSKEKLGSPLFLGRIDGEKAAKYAEVFFDPKKVSGIYLCGPAQMIFDVKESLIQRGVAEDLIHFELFTTKDIPTPKKKEVTKTSFDPDSESQVTVILDGESFDFTLPYGGENILDAALAQGADLPFACKGGVCCTCKARIEEGKIDMSVNYTLEPEEVEAGFVLTCQSHPRTPRTIVNFDEA